jgi:hypothetical protein
MLCRTIYVVFVKGSLLGNGTEIMKLLNFVSYMIPKLLLSTYNCMELHVSLINVIKIRILSVLTVNTVKHYAMKMYGGKEV